MESKRRAGRDLYRRRHNLRQTRFYLRANSKNDQKISRIAGIILNREKSIWIPSQKGEFLGFNIDTTKMEFSVPSKKIEQLLSFLSEALNLKKWDANFIARIAGKIISMGPALGPISRLMTRSLYTFYNLGSLGIEKSS